MTSEKTTVKVYIDVVDAPATPVLVFNDVWPNYDLIDQDVYFSWNGLAGDSFMVRRSSDPNFSNPRRFRAHSQEFAAAYDAHYARRRCLYGEIARQIYAMLSTFTMRLPAVRGCANRSRFHTLGYRRNTRVATTEGGHGVYCPITPRERILTALARQAPDRVPVMELSIDWNTVRGLGCRTYFDLVDHLDLDAVSANQVQYMMGLRPLLFRLRRTYSDRWGVRRRLGLELLPDILSHPMRGPEDLRCLRVPNPRRDPAIAAVRATARRFGGRRAVFFVARDVFADAWNLCGLENLLAAFVLDPAFAEELIRTVKEYNLELHRHIIRAGADFIVLGDDYAQKTATLMSPGHFRRFVLPGFAEVVRNIHASGVPCVKHTDGNVWAILEDLVATGLDALGPLEPGAGMDLAEVKRRFGARVCVIGNLDVDLLCRGSEEEVHGATHALLERVSAGGGHILSSGNSITSAVRPRNFLAMVQAARDFSL